MVLKGPVLDYWLIWLFLFFFPGFAKSQPIYRIANCYVYMCVCLGCHTGQSLWQSWPVASSANAIGLHHHHC